MPTSRASSPNASARAGVSSRKVSSRSGVSSRNSSSRGGDSSRSPPARGRSIVHARSPGSHGALRARLAIPADFEGLAPHPDDAWRHDNIGRLLIVAFHAYGERVVHGIHASGHTDLRFVHLNLFRTVDYERGTRIVDLARRNGIGKAAMGQLAREGERLGLFTINTDAADRRARIVRFTARGRALHQIIRRELIRAERELASLLGRTRYRALRQALLLLRQRLATQQSWRQE